MSNKYTVKCAHVFAVSSYNHPVVEVTCMRHSATKWGWVWLLSPRSLQLRSTV